MRRAFLFLAVALVLAGPAVSAHRPTKAWRAAGSGTSAYASLFGGDYMGALQVWNARPERWNPDFERPGTSFADARRFVVEGRCALRPPPAILKTTRF